MKIRDKSRHANKNDLPMAPMIDIVFLLLVFFIMTFRIVTMEGDFNVNTAKGADDSDIQPPLPIMVELQSDSDGNIADIVLQRPTGDLSLGPDFQKLTDEVVAYVGAGPQRDVALHSMQVIFDCDEHLRYEEAVNALTAVSGYIENDQLVTLVKNVQFRDLAP